MTTKMTVNMPTSEQTLVALTKVQLRTIATTFAIIADDLHEAPDSHDHLTEAEALKLHLLFKEKWENFKG